MFVIYQKLDEQISGNLIGPAGYAHCTCLRRVSIAVVVGFDITINSSHCKRWCSGHLEQLFWLPTFYCTLVGLVLRDTLTFTDRSLSARPVGLT